ncbi:hypothetical protein RJ641_009482 [Dillenia turbinata]|uniref:Uncharacterized protein n=1 Tax=Dillenia turbinata TaxID=194707 RepID=A0AAN8Z554_9MAGN
MCTPWPLTRKEKWKVESQASSFFCGFPLDEGYELRISRPQVSVSSMVFDVENYHGRHGTTRIVSPNNKHGQRRKLKQNSTQTHDTRTGESGWPRSSEEEYIVFSFREDGELYVVKDRQTQAETSYDRHCLSECSRAVNTKAEEEESIYFDPDSPSDGLHWLDDYNEETRDHHASFISSSNSDDSNSSTGSFAFPVRQLDWDGSQVKMPKSESPIRSRKQRLRIALHCCRF